MSNFCVTIIEPDTMVSSQMETGFQAHGIVAHVLGEGDPLDFVRHHGPQLILLNAELPGRSGFALCNRLKRQKDLQTIPIILTSLEATAEVFAQHQQSKTPADAYVRKQDQPSVEGLVENVLGMARNLVPSAFDPNAAPPSPETTQAFAEVQGDLSIDPSHAGSSPLDDDAVMASGEGKPPPLPRSKAKPPRARTLVPRTGRSLKELLDAERSEDDAPQKVTGRGLEEKIAALRTSLKRKESDLHRANALWAERDSELAQIVDALEVRERELERSKKAREDLVAQLTQAEDRTASLFADVEIGRERAERLDREKKALAHELQDHSDAAEHEISKLKSDVEELDREISQQAETRALESEAHAQELEGLGAQLESGRAELVEKTAEFNQQHAHDANEIGDLGARIATLSVAKEGLESDLGERGVELESARATIAQAKAQKAEDDQRFESNRLELETQVRDLENDKTGLEGDLAELRAERDSLQGDFDALSSTKTDLEAELLEVQGQVSDLSLQLSESETQGDELALELANLKNQAGDLENQTLQLTAQLSQRESELADFAQRGELLQNELDAEREARQSENQSAQNVRSGLEADVATRDEQLIAAAEEKARLLSQIKERDARILSLERDLQVESDGRTTDVGERDTKIFELEGTLERTRNDAHEAERAAKSSEAELRALYDDAKAKNEEFDRDLERTRAKAKDLDLQLDEDRSKISELAKDLERQKSAYQGAREDVAQLTGETESLRAELGKTQSDLHDTRDEAQRHKEQADDRAKRLTQEWQAEQQANDESATALRNDLEQLSADLAGVRESLSQRSDELAMRDQELSSTKDALEKENAERASLEKRLQALTETVSEAQHSAETLGDENARIKGLLDKAQSERDRLRKDIAEKSDSFKSSEATLVRNLESLQRSRVDDEQKLLSEKQSLENDLQEQTNAYRELKRKASTLKKRYDQQESTFSEKSDTLAKERDALRDELNAEREQRARERATLKEDEKRLRKKLAAAEESAGDESALLEIQARLKQRDERIAKIESRYTELQEKAKKAIATARKLDEKLKNAKGGGEEQLQELRDKYGKAVTQLKSKQEQLKKRTEAHEELVAKYRKLLAAAKKLQEEK